MPLCPAVWEKFPKEPTKPLCCPLSVPLLKCFPDTQRKYRQQVNYRTMTCPTVKYSVGFCFAIHLFSLLFFRGNGMSAFFWFHIFILCSQSPASSLKFMKTVITLHNDQESMKYSIPFILHASGILPWGYQNSACISHTVCI